MSGELVDTGSTDMQASVTTVDDFEEAEMATVVDNDDDVEWQIVYTAA